MSSKRTGREASPATNGGGEIPAELCIASDGTIYVNAEGIDPAKLQGRRMFHGFAMSEEEMAVAVHQIHRLAFNITLSVQEEMHQRRAKRLKRRQRRASQKKGRENTEGRATRREQLQTGELRGRPSKKQRAASKKHHRRSRKKRP